MTSKASINTIIKSVVKNVFKQFGLDLRRLPRHTGEFQSLLETKLRENTGEAYNLLYGSDECLKLYLCDDRISFYRMVAKKVVQSKPSSLIDVGCGSGHFLKEVSNMHKCMLAGAELTKNGTDLARKIIPDANIRQCSVNNVTDVFEKHRFDLVCCLQVLEHLEDPGAAIVELSKLKSIHGKLIVTVPDGRMDTWEGHINFWSETSLKHFLSQWGDFQIEKIDNDLIAVEL